MHQAQVLEVGDTLYVGVLNKDGDYTEVRLANVNNELLVTPSSDRVKYSGGQ